MAGIGFVLDPTSEDATNTQLDINDGTNFAVVDEPDFGPPDLDSQFASSSDTEGAALASIRHQNRRIVVSVRVYGQTAAGLDTQLAKLQQKVGKIVRQAGTLKLTVPSTKTVVYDLLDAQVTVPIRKRLVTNFVADTTLTFTAKPYGRGAAQTFSTHSETTLPVLIFTETGIGGDVPALGRLEVTDTQGVDQWYLTYGIQSRSYDSASTAALFYEAEALTPQGGAATAVGVAPSSGAGSNTVLHSSLGTPWQSILSTRLSGGSQLTHWGNYRVFARARATGSPNSIQMRLEWAAGDLRAPTQNDAVAVPIVAWALYDLGDIDIPKVARGTQQWEGRFLARTDTPGEGLAIDYIFLVPTEAWGEARGVAPTATPSAFNGRDEFAQTAGALTGKTAAVGGAWVGAGDADDFSVVAGTKTADRTAVSDSGFTPRRMTLSNGSLTDTVASIDFMTGAGTWASWRAGLILRHDAASGRHLRVYMSTQNAGTPSPAIWFYGELFTGDTSNGYITPSGVGPFPWTVTAGQWYTLRALVDAAGRVWVWFGNQGGPLTLYLVGQDSTLATGGTRATGLYGFFDYKFDANAQTRSFDNFWAAAAPKDAAIFASQSAEIRYDSVIREDAAGAIWSPVSNFEGDYLTIPPAGMESRTARVIVKACRNDIANSANVLTNASDVAIDDISATLTVIPRYLNVPE